MPDGNKGFTVSTTAIGTPSDDHDRQPQREKIIDAVMAAGMTFWRDRDGIAYATVILDATIPNGAVAHYRMRGRRFGLTVRRIYGLANPVHGQRGTRPGAVSDSAMGEAIPALEALALAGPACQPAVRLAENCGAVWIDLGDDTHHAIRVTSAGWTVETRAEAPLIRPDGLRSLPIPVRSAAAMAKLRALMNIGDGDEATATFRLVVAWLVAALYPTGPYCVLAIDGEQGSGKSTSCRMLRRLVDPNAADLRAPPRNEDDLLIAALNGRVIGLDNVSFIEADTADAICRIATGAGFGKRRLYADAEEVIISVARPVLLNGIPSLLARGDLADRSIAVTLPPIADASRRPEAEVWRDFDAAAPGILGSTVDGLAMALRRLPTLHLPNLPRMADFARLACAAAPSFGWTERDMLAALQANRVAAVHTVIEADPLAEAVQAIGTSGRWTGSATALLAKINGMVAPEEQRPEAGRRMPRVCLRGCVALRLPYAAPKSRSATIARGTTAAASSSSPRSRAPQIARQRVRSVRRAPDHCGRWGELQFSRGRSCGRSADSARARVRTGGPRTLENGPECAGTWRRTAVADAADIADADLYSPPIRPAKWRARYERRRRARPRPCRGLDLDR